MGFRHTAGMARKNLVDGGGEEEENPAPDTPTWGFFQGIEGAASLEHSPEFWSSMRDDIRRKRRVQRLFDFKSACLEAAMWSAAALQNLAASYCDVGTGRCAWVPDVSNPAGNTLVLSPAVGAV